MKNNNTEDQIKPYFHIKIDDHLHIEVDGEPKLNWYLAKCINRHNDYRIAKDQGYMIARITYLKNPAYIVVSNSFDGFMNNPATTVIPEHIAKQYLQTVRDSQGKLIRVLPEVEAILNHNYSNYDDKVNACKCSYWERWQQEEMNF